MTIYERALKFAQWMHENYAGVGTPKCQAHIAGEAEHVIRLAIADETKTLRDEDQNWTARYSRLEAAALAFANCERPWLWGSAVDVTNEPTCTEKGRRHDLCRGCRLRRVIDGLKDNDYPCLSVPTTMEFKP